MDTGSRKVVGTFEGEKVEEVLLTSEGGVSIAILSYAALIREWRVPVNGVLRPVTLGFESFEPYPANSPYFGAIAGRVANRTGNSRFTLDGTVYELEANEGANHLHGGPKGFGKRNWKIAEYDGKRVTLTLSSPDGDMGYPGAVEASVTYTLDGHRLDITFEATANKATPINIVQHNYFNLMGEGEVCDHTLWLAASAYTPVDKAQIPTGSIEPVHGTDFDFRTPGALRGADGEGAAIDHNFVLDTHRSFDDPVAIFTAPDKSLSLKLFTDQPGLQVYTGWKLNVNAPGLDGQSYRKFAGLCLEDQCFPDAVNNSHFPSPIIGAGETYKHRCAIEIA